MLPTMGRRNLMSWKWVVVVAACLRLAAASRAEPKAAICFYGLTRSLPYTIDRIRSSIIDPLIEDRIGYSVFLHTYNVSKVNDPRSGEHQVAVNWRAYRRLQPTASVVEDADVVFDKDFKARFDSLLRHGDPWDEPHHTSLRNMLLQLHSLKKVAMLYEEAAREHGPFDVIIALRSDLWFFNSISIEHVRAAMQTNSMLYTPAFDTWEGLNDRVAFGHPDAMLRIMHRLNDAQLYSQNKPLHSETFLKYVVDSNELTAVDTDIIFERVRGNGFLHQIPRLETHKRGGFAGWEPGKWMHLNRLAMWELSEMPPGFATLESIVRKTTRQRKS